MIRHMTVGQLRICIAVVCILFIWTTAKYMSYNLPSPDRQMVENSEPSEKRIDPVKVEVFYECLCPDSRSFVLSQLVPTYKKLSKYIDLRMIPYGKAQTYKAGGKTKFECQHGPTECQGNAVHACTLDVVQKQSITLDLIACMIDDNSDPDQAGRMCTEKFGVSKWPEISTCVKGNRSVELLEKAGLETDSLGGIKFVPTIRLQGSVDRQKYILKSLFHEICRLYVGMKPAACPTVANL